jgi:hypothetical protein
MFVNLGAPFVLCRKGVYDRMVRKQVVHLVAVIAADELDSVVH